MFIHIYIQACILPVLETSLTSVLLSLLIPSSSPPPSLPYPNCKVNSSAKPPLKDAIDPAFWLPELIIEDFSSQISTSILFG